MSEYNIQMNKYNALNVEYDQLYPATKIENVDGLNTTLQNKVEIELLWENAAPTSSFAGQTISLDLSEYNFVLVEILQTISGDLQPDVIVPVTNLVNREVITNHLVDLGRMATRGFAASTSAVKFSDCKYYTSPYTSVAGTENAYSIPWRVYGIKA